MQPDGFRLLFVGNRGHSRWILRHLLDAGWNVAGVVTRSEGSPSRAIDRERFDDVCDKYDVPLHRTDDINESETREFIDSAAPDLGLCCGWTQIVSEDILDVPTDGFVGIHASDLPKGKGGAPVNWQLILDNHVGVSLFYFVPEVDHGDIIAQERLEIEPRDDIETLYNKVTDTSCRLLDEALPALRDGTVEASPQTYAEATYLPQRTPDDGLVDWSRPATFIHDWVRALTRPYPGAFTFFEGEQVLLWSTAMVEGETKSVHPGEILAIDDGRGVLVGTGDGAVRLERVQVDGHPPMWADDFAERYDLAVGDAFGTPSDFPQWLYTSLRGANGAFDFETNVPLGDSGTTVAVACSHHDQREVRIHAIFDGETCLDRTRTVDGWIREPITYAPEKSGSHTLKINFESEDGTIDTRYIKVFSGE
ncbi:methionyl-tRNA formyltransferase [Halobellus inordinatus]|uniref:methionyl-tRNA formyltransferase n=1 Tax=Halobellus inordinatus TaxID=1126236 RepID=UPI00210A0EB6|nr:methionyl-tRNA formyltransferase [Halobellus inordinatus]